MTNSSENSKSFEIIECLMLPPLVVHTWLRSRMSYHKKSLFVKKLYNPESKVGYMKIDFAACMIPEGTVRFVWAKYNFYSIGDY